MDIEVNENKQQASFRNGKFYHTFTPTTANQTVKLYHMGCVGDTRLNRIQLEQGTEPTGFVAPKHNTNTLSGIFKNLRDLDVKMTDPDSDFWTRIKKTARGTIEEYHTSTLSNEIVKTAEGIVERQTRTINSSVDEKINGAKNELNTRVATLTSQSKRHVDEVADVLSRRIDGVTTNVSTVSRTVDSINSNITSLEGNVLKKNEISITSNGVTLGSGKVIDGRTITSLITTQPENIKAITDKFIITPANENLVKREYRDNFILNVRNGVLNKIYGSNTDLEGEYYFKLAIVGWDTPRLYASIRVTYTDGKEEWFNSEFPIPSFATLETSTSVKVQVKASKEIEYIEPLVFQDKWSNFYRFYLKNLFVGKKKSAELIVDGTIEGKHIKSSSIETGHLKAGSVTSEIISSNAIKSKHLQVDDAMIDKIIGNQAFVTKLWAKDAFINNLNAIKITAVDLSGKVISSPQILGGTISSSTKFILGDNGYMRPINNGLQIFAENSNALSSGVILQLHGYEKIISSSQTIPRGLYLYNEKNFNEKSSDTFLTYETLLTVDGMIKIRGFARGKEYGYFGAGIPTLNYPLIGGSDIGSSSFAAICRLSLETIIGGRDYLIVETPTNTYRVPTAQNSDIRLKENLKETKVKALDYIEKIKFKSFDWKDKTLGEEKLGVIAQELEKIEPSFVSKLGDIGGKEGHYVLELSTLCIYSLKSIQELSIQNKELQQRIIKLEEKING